MLRTILVGAALAAATVGLAGSAAGAATPTTLLVPQATAFSVLGRSCGGIQEQALATGFDPTSGLPTGAVYLQTRCGGSGRGSHTTTYSAWLAVTWGFDGTVSSYVKLPGAPGGLDPALSITDGQGDQVYNVLSPINVLPSACSVGNTTYCTYRAYLTVPLPGMPTAVTVSQSGAMLNVSWTAASGPISFSTVTATPVAGGTTLTATATGAATSVAVSGAAGSTTYAITVTSTDPAGTGPAAAPVTFTTKAASIAPSAPTGVVLKWGSGGSVLLASWLAAVPGDSAVDGYQLRLNTHDPIGTPSVLDVGLVTAWSVTGLNSNLDWSVQVRAHNAAGWGTWSTLKVLPAF